jgi:hypothetical protein
MRNLYIIKIFIKMFFFNFNFKIIYNMIIRAHIILKKTHKPANEISGSTISEPIKVSICIFYDFLSILTNELKDLEFSLFMYSPLSCFININYKNCLIKVVFFPFKFLYLFCPLVINFFFIISNLQVMLTWFMTWSLFWFPCSRVHDVVLLDISMSD